MEMQIEGSGSGSRRETIIGCDWSGEKMKFSDPLGFGVVGGDFPIFIFLPVPERLLAASHETESIQIDLKLRPRTVELLELLSSIR